MHIPEPKQNKDGTWRIQLRIKGQSHVVTANTAKECKRLAAIAKAEAQAAAHIKQCDLTLSQAIDNYIAARKQTKSPATIRGYRIIQKHRFQPQMDRKLSTFRPTEWRDIIGNELMSASYKTVKNAWGLVKSVLESNGVPVDAAVCVQKPKTKKQYIWLEPEEIKKFVPAAAESPLCIPILLALMGMRISEIDALRWDDIQKGAEFIHTSGARVLDENNEWVEKRDQKNESSDRNVPLVIPELRAAVAAKWQAKGKLLTVSQATLRSAVERVCQSAGVKRVTVHQLRHSFASLSAHLRIPKEISMEIGGWSNDKIMSEIYTHVARSDIERYKNELWNFYNEK